MNEEFSEIVSDLIDSKSPTARCFSLLTNIQNQNANADALIFEAFKTSNTDSDSDIPETVSVSKFLLALQSKGLKKSDPRLEQMMKKFQQVQRERLSERDNVDPYNLVLDRDTFKRCIQDNHDLIVRALSGQFIIPDWPEFCIQVEPIYSSKISLEGKYFDPSQPRPRTLTKSDLLWGVSVCTVDGQRNSWGDCAIPWCFQSICKPLTYGIALDEYGAEYVHSYVGQEPSGRVLNEICLDHNDAVYFCFDEGDSLLADRFDFLMQIFKKMAGGEYVGLSNTTFQQERETPDRNSALAYYLREHEVSPVSCSDRKCFPKGVNLKQTLDLYFQLCSVEVTCESAAVIAATLANGGVCPLTNSKILNNRSIRDVLSLMYSCGMYDLSGQFAFQIGLPAKSGNSGGLILVIPNVMGFAFWSPLVDNMGNTIRGVAFCRELVDTFNFHNYDNLVHGDTHKIDPRKRFTVSPEHQLVSLLSATANNDLNLIKRFSMHGVDMEGKNYDGRTALHIAASEGHVEIVKYLLHTCRVNPNIRDRWQRSASDSAKRFCRTDCHDLIKQYKKELIELKAQANVSSFSFMGKKGGTSKSRLSSKDRKVPSS